MTVTPLRRRLLEYATEAELEDYVAASARAFGWMRYHTHDARRSPEGFPDDVLVHPRWRLTIIAELKGFQNIRTTPRLGKPTAEQVAWLQALRDAGQFAYLWTPLDVDLIDRVLEHGNVDGPLPPLPAPTASRRPRP